MILRFQSGILAYYESEFTCLYVDKLSFCLLELLNWFLSGNNFYIMLPETSTYLCPLSLAYFYIMYVYAGGGDRCSLLYDNSNHAYLYHSAFNKCVF